MNYQAVCELPRRIAQRDRIAAILISVASFFRGLPLFFAVRPKTPLRVLCVMAFDTLHMLRHSHRLCGRKRTILAALLDFGACANAAFDHKDFCLKELHTTRQILDDAGIGATVEVFLQRLRELEKLRPLPGDDDWQFHQVASYREAVVQVFLGMVTATTIGNQCLDDGIRATDCDDDLKILFRMVMLCQIIDDVLDYSKDTAAGLPSFLTGSRSLPRAFELTRMAAARYAFEGDLVRAEELFPLRVALVFVSACAKLVIRLGRWRLFVRPNLDEFRAVAARDV